MGDRVYVAKLNSHGTIASFTDEQAKAAVDVDGLRFTVKTGELGLPRENADEPNKGHATTTVKISKPRARGRTPSEINLLGQRVDEAIDRLERFLDHAALAGLTEVRVVHGFGTGRLQKGVHQWLRQRAEVAGFRLGKHGEDPGGGGVTLVRLR